MITVGGTMRTYDLILPAGYDGSTPQPVYFVYHGRDADHTAVTPYGLQDNAIGVFPDGLNKNGTIGWDTSVGGIDVAMFDAVLQAVEANTCVDQSRVYAAGFSWGASMANALGCFRANVLRAFASAEGGILFGNGSNDCKGPIPAWINQYKMDPTVSYATGQKAEQFFLTLDSASNPQPYDAPNPCVINMGKAPVVWCTPPDAEHAWPPYGTAAVKSFFATL
jgi:polyhydroxybutyrate depolymerase